SPMLLSLILLPTLSRVLTQDLDDFPCPNTLPFPSTIESSHEDSCKRVSHLAHEQLQERNKRIVKRQVGLEGFGNGLGGLTDWFKGPPDGSPGPERLLCANEAQRQIIQHVVDPLLSDGRVVILRKAGLPGLGGLGTPLGGIGGLGSPLGGIINWWPNYGPPTDGSPGRARLEGCVNEELGRIIRHVVEPLVNVPQTKIGDIALILQQSIHQATGRSHEIIMGKADPRIASHQMSETKHCRLQIGDFHVTAYETPVLYVVNRRRRGDEDEEEDDIMPYIECGEPLGACYTGQLPWGRYDPLEAGLLDVGGFINTMECFSGDLVVETIGGPKQMRELKTGDEVFSIEHTMVMYSPIVMFLHRDEEMITEFNVITTAKGSTVKLTNEHLIYVSDCNAHTPFRLVKASDVTTEHCVMTARLPHRDPNLERVANVSKTIDRGIYAPLTKTGEIIVNDVISSCHSNLGVKILQNTFFRVYRFLIRPFSSIFSEEGAIPLGIEYLTSVIDLFIPTKAF
ncbi:hypothetical protein PENTCL1PPCAC_3574, partial [Pristionchus entomophagus]